MDLHKAPLFHDKRVTVHSDAHNEEWNHLEFHEFSSIRELQLERKAILWTVIGRLMHLKTLLNKANFAWRPIDAEHLLNEIAFTKNPFRRPKVRSKINPILAGLGVLQRIIISASDRQGLSPFSPFLPSLFNKLFPSPASPGQISTGIGDAIRAASIEWPSGVGDPIGPGDGYLEPKN